MAAKQRLAKQQCYLWEGNSRSGSRLNGETYAANIALVKAELRSQGITPTKVYKKPIKLFTLNKQKISSRDITSFTRQLATMLGAGIPLLQTIDLINRGQSNPKMRLLLDQIRQELSNGSTLAESLAKHPKHFNPLYCSLIRVGEHSGTLDILLARIASYREKTETIKAQVKKALIYPATVIAVAIIVTSILMIFVIPQFEELFHSFGADLPLLTRVVINIANFLHKNILIFILLIITTALGIHHAKKRVPAFAYLCDRLVLRIPVIGNIIQKAIIARFARTLATTFAAGVTLVDGLTSVADAVGNLLYRDACLKIRTEISTGHTLNLGLQTTQLFPNMVVQMVAIGENSGTLEDMLNKVAALFEEEVDVAVASLNTLLEPFIIILLGVVVGGLVIAMFLPIFQLGNVIH